MEALPVVVLAVAVAVAGKASSETAFAVSTPPADGQALERRGKTGKPEQGHRSIFSDPKPPQRLLMPIGTGRLCSGFPVQYHVGHPLM